MANFQELLQPIEGINPSGEDLRYSDLFDALKEARRSEDHELSYGIWQTTLKNTDWSKLQELAENALKTKTKDLQIATWLVECWIIKDKMAGLHFGIEFISAFIKKFWKNFYPQNDELRQNLFEWIDHTLADHILSLPMNENLLKTINLSTWKKCIFIDQMERRKIDIETQCDLDAFRRLLSANSADFVENYIKQIREIIDQIKALKNYLLLNMGESAPGFTESNTYLSEILSIFENEFKAPEEVPPEIIEEVESQKMEGPRITSKEDAYNALFELAQYIKRIDPQSLSSILIDLAIAWKDKNLLEILEELNNTHNPQYKVLKILGENVGK